MGWILGALGVLVLLFTLVDLVWTTLTLRAAGPITRTLANLVWRTAMGFHSRGNGRHLLLSQAGWVILVLTATVWVLLTWGGWALVFASGSDAVVQSDTREPADLAALLYFSGFAVYTLGVGDYVPNGPLWQVLTPVAAINGFILITLAVTYFIQVISAAVGDRTVARIIHSLGGTPAGILANSWNGESFASLSGPLSQISQMLAEHSQEHHAYPVLHYFHEADTRAALPLQIAILGEALARVQTLCGEKHGVDRLALGGIRAAIETVWESLPAVAETQVRQQPPPPAELVFPGWTAPAPAEHQTERRLQCLKEHRKHLLGLAQSDGWNWRRVEGAGN